jgi:hypothetical protein
MLVLDGNNPRFPWEPSTTMMANRIEGNYRGFGVRPERTQPFWPHDHIDAPAATGTSDSTSSLVPASSPGALRC